MESKEKTGSGYFVMRSGRSYFPHKHRENDFRKTMSNDRLLPIKDTGTTKDGRWDKQKKEKDNAFL